MEHKQEYDEHFKIILLGNNAVGKSCLLHAYCGGTFCSSDLYMDTMGVDQEIKWVNTFNKKVQLRIWDASGAPKLQNIVASYFQFVDGALICFDLTHKTSLQHTKEYVTHLRATKGTIPMILVGCKADLEQRREVSYAQAKDFANELGLDYLEVSAFKNINIEELFAQFTLQIYLFKQLDKIKPALNECFNNYLKLTNPNRTHLFRDQYLTLAPQGELKAQYKAQFEKLFASRSVDEVADFCGKTLELIERANNFYKHDSPVLSTFLASPLANALKDILDSLNRLLGELMGLTAARDLIYQNKSLEHTLVETDRQKVY